MSPDSHPPARPAPPAWHVVPLVVLAVSHPIAEVLVNGPEFFVAYDMARVSLLWLGFWLFAGLPAALWACCAAARRLHRGFGEWLTLAVVIVLLAALWLRVLGGSIDDAIVLPVSAAAGLISGLLYRYLRPLQRFTSFLAPVPVAAAMLFFSATSVATLMRSAVVPASAASGRAAGGPVVMVVFDQLPVLSLLDGHGQIDAARYPAFAELAAGGTWYRNVTAASDLTNWALPALLTGHAPHRDRLPSAIDHPENLFSLLASSHRLDVVEPLTALCGPLCPDSQLVAERWIPLASDLAVVYGHVMLPPGVVERLPPLTSDWRGFGEGLWHERWVTRRTGDRHGAMLDWIDRIRADEPPTLHFIHVLLPHEPFVHLPSGQITAPAVLPGLQSDGRWMDDEGLVTLNYTRHLLQVQFVDHLLSRLLDRLRETGLYDNALIAVAADHGAAFRAGQPFRLPGGDTLADIAGVPFILRHPGQQDGRVVDEPLQAIDVLPTIADALGIDLPWSVDGRTTGTAAGPPEPRHIYVDRAGRAVSIEPGTFEQALAAAERWKFATLSQSHAAAAGLQTGNGDLLDTRIDAAPTGRRSDLDVLVDGAAALAAVDLDSEFVPTYLSGVVRQDGQPTREPVRLAIAVNGTIRSMAETAAEDVMGRPGFWAALVPPDALQAGANEVVVFEVADAGRGVELRPTGDDAVTASPANLLEWAVQTGLGAVIDGFHNPEHVEEFGSFRWTNGHGQIRIPLDPAAPPAAVEVNVLMRGPEITTLEVRANDCRLFHGPIEWVPWTERLPLAECLVPGADALTLSFISDAFVPATDDARTLGVGIGSATLIPAP